jgi:hypothetical protein
VVLLCQCSINSQQDQTCPFLVKKEYLVPFWVRRPKENQEKKKKKKSGKIEWCRLVLFVQKKRLQQSEVFCRKYVVVCSFYLSFSVLTENPDAQNGHNNQSVQSKLCYYPILVYPFSWEVLFSRSIWLMNGFFLGFLFCKNILAFTHVLQWNLVIVNSGLSPILITSERFLLLPDSMIFSFITYS